MGDSSTAPAGPTDVPRRPKTGAERQRAFRQREREKRKIALASAGTASPGPIGNQIATATFEPPVTTSGTVTPVTVSALPVTLVTDGVTSRVTDEVTVSRPHVTERRSITSYCLTAAALALAGVGLVMNGWFARTLGSTDLAGWTFLASGMANDVVALTVPAAAARLWLARQRVTAAVAWLVWSASFIFALISSLGFASVNIADTAMARASRVTPAVTIAQNALRDAVTSRDRECAGGVGRFCREREQTVIERQRALDAAVGSVERAVDPQTEAASKIVAWLSAGNANPTATDFAMLRLLLLSLLPQIGGLLLMIGRAR
ncbi:MULTISPECIES: hypothetical protein [unclassified Bradyrhizobium]|uniref:hypothetical protein n=1 Tax=unclassified Bradyrhizobium TaxID=2631580 RepID=UPI0024791CA9|nr:MULTISPECIES: hypothetical protein [unclassified Bradyrhizobium]WGS20196.1 hypothetical protein MTX22_38910 [Bradyrhizobium sp. ISRA463]WGS27059.1 hypothetical protein MTX19_36335 [Bradyrhizobium sp. ISRA464]